MSFGCWHKVFRKNVIRAMRLERMPRVRRPPTAGVHRVSRRHHVSAAGEAVVRRFYDEMKNGRKLELAADLFTADHTMHDP